MNQHNLWIKWLFYGVATLLCILLQSLVCNRLCFLQTHPFIFPILVATVVVLEPPQESVIYALTLGALCDLTIPGILPCFYTVTFVLSALLCILIAERVIVPGFWCCTVCGAMSVLLCDLFNALLFHYRYSTRLLDALLLSGREILLSVPLVLLVYFLFHRINLRTKID